MPRTSSPPLPVPKTNEAQNRTGRPLPSRAAPHKSSVRTLYLIWEGLNYTIVPLAGNANMKLVYSNPFAAMARFSVSSTLYPHFLFDVSFQLVICNP